MAIDSNEVQLGPTQEAMIDAAIAGAVAAVPNYLVTPEIGERQAIDEFDPQRLVRVDKVCVALWLMAARYLIEDHANALRDIQQAAINFMRTMFESAGTKMIVKAVWRRGIPAVGTFYSLIGQAKRMFELKASQNSLAKYIRSESQRIRKDLVASAWNARSAHPRKTKLVHTRTYSPPQRRTNKNWRSPKAPWRPPRP